MLGAGFRQIAIEVVVDKNYLRCAFILLTPIQVFFTLVSRLKWRRKGFANAGIVLRASHRRLSRADDRPHQTDETE